jgi:hypothetical protein
VFEAFCEGMSVGALFYRNFQTYFSGLARKGIYFYASPSDTQFVGSPPNHRLEK